jgi:hypothetical protein
MAHHDEVPEWDPEFLEFKKTLEVDVKATFHSFRSHIDQLTSVTQKVYEIQEKEAVGEVDLVSHDAPINTEIVALVGKIKDEVTQALEILNSLKLHFALQQPKIVSKDWKSSVQQEILAEIKMAHLGGVLIVKTLSDYSFARAKVIQMGFETPDINFSKALSDFDSNQFINLRRWLRDLENFYLFLYDTIYKNAGNLDMIDTSLSPQGKRNALRRSLTSSLSHTSNDDKKMSLFKKDKK